MRLTNIFLQRLFTVPAVFFTIAVTSCTQLQVYEKHTAIPNYEWKSNYTVTGSFAVADTVSAYNIYLVLRHTDGYRYNNIWLNIGLQQPGDSMHFQKVDLQLATDATGWQGSGMNDIWEVRKLLTGMAEPFKKTGTYKFSIAQIMRDNPLQGVMSAGIRVEKEGR